VEPCIETRDMQIRLHLRLHRYISASNSVYPASKTPARPFGIKPNNILNMIANLRGATSRPVQGTDKFE
jgi:hypothetical protein